MSVIEALTGDQQKEHQERLKGILGQDLVQRSLDSHHTSFDSAADGNPLSVEDPATGHTIAEIPAHPAAALGQVIDAAQELFLQWRGQPQAQLIGDVADAVDAHAHLFAEVITAESGKALGEARGEVTYAVSFLRWFAARACEPSGHNYVMAATGQRCSVSRRGVGPALVVTPWNFPLAMITRKVAAAWAAGCPVIGKPAETTPLTALLFAQVCRDAGLPSAAFQSVISTDPGATVAKIMADRRVRKVSFTGSTRVGQIIAAQAAANLQRASLELGGNAAFVVCADAEAATTKRAMQVAKFRNAGQTCIAANRFLVHSSRLDEVVTTLQDLAERQVMGSGFDRRTTLGPMISGPQQQRAHQMVVDAEAAGAIVHRAGPQFAGAFFRPVVVTGLSTECALWREEIFAPVATVMPFDCDDEAIALANDTDYGLANYVMTESVRRRALYVDQLHSGMVGVNTGAISDAAAPFGGVGLSGYGREGGAEGLAEYQETRYVADLS